MNTDLFGAATVPSTQADPEMERKNDYDKDHGGDDIDCDDEKDEAAEVHSDQAPCAPIHVADAVVTNCLEDTVMLAQAMRVHTAAMEGAGVPVIGEGPCDERVPGQEKEAEVMEGGGVPVLGEYLCGERVLGQEKEGDHTPATMTYNNRSSEVEVEGHNRLKGGGREQHATLNVSDDVYAAMHRADEGGDAVLDAAVKGMHADSDNSRKILNGPMNIDSGDWLDRAAGKHRDGDGDGDGDGDMQIEEGRYRDGDQAEGGKKTIEEGLRGIGVETVSARQGTDQIDQARAPHAGNISADNDSRVREIEYERRLQNLEKNMKLFLAKNNTSTGRVSRAQEPVQDENVATPNGGNSPRRGDRLGLQEHLLIQGLQHFFILVVCCTAMIMLLTRCGIISLFPVYGGLHPVHGCQSEPFDPLEKAMVPVSEKGEKPGHEGHEGDTPLPAKGVEDDISVGAVELQDKKGDKILNVAIKLPPARKWWNMFAVLWKQPLGLKVTNGFACKSKDDGHNSGE
eukprot:jgi/Undpi1/150/HiC_scaffold_1.g00147.m2